MELISPMPLTEGQELKQELFQRAEELERLVAAYKLKLCSGEMNPLNYGSKLSERRYSDVFGDQRGQFYEIYMKKREAKLREEWRIDGAKKETEMRAMMESLARTSSRMMSKAKVTEPMNNHFRQINSRKFSSSSSDSSTSQSSATTSFNPTFGSSNLASLRKENTKPLKGASNETTLQSSIARSKSSSDKMSLFKDIRASRSQSLRKNSASLGEPKDFILLSSKPDTLTPPVHTNLQRNGAPRSFLRKSIDTGPNAGLSVAKQRIPMASPEENQLEDSIEILKEENEHSESLRDEAIQKLRFNIESSNSAYHRFESSSRLAESLKSRNSHVQEKVISNVHEVSGSDSSGDSHKMNQYLEGMTVRARKKWGSVERPFPAVEASTHSTMNVTKGIKRFFKLGERSKGVEIQNDIDHNCDSEDYSFDDLRNSRMGQIPSYDCFNEDVILHEQVNLTHNPSHSASLKERKKCLLRNHPKAARSLFSLPSFHGRENETKS